MGADQLGEKWATSNLVTYKVYMPDYQKYKLKAPLVRNQQMVEEADVLVAFHLNDSPGTRDIIHKANKWNLKVIVFKVKEK